MYYIHEKHSRASHRRHLELTFIKELVEAGWKIRDVPTFLTLFFAE